MKKLYVVVLMTVIAACASVQPAAVNAGDRCIRCRRPIGDLRMAAEIVDHLKAPFPFRTAGCLAKYIKGHPGEQLAGVFVTDYRTGHMLAAEDAWFVPTTVTDVSSRRVEQDFLAFRSRSDADSFRAERQPMLRWAQVLAEATAN